MDRNNMRNGVLPIRKTYLRLFAILIVINSVYAVSWLGTIKYHNAVIELIINIAIIGISFVSFRSRRLEDRGNYKIVSLYFIWMLFHCIRGLLGCDIYMDYRQLVDGSVMLSLPILVYPFAYPGVVQYVMRKWFVWGGLVFVIFILWNTGPNCLYLAPIVFFACFFFELPHKWRVIIGGVLLIWLLQVLDRANFMRTAMVITCALGIKYRRYISSVFLMYIHHFFYWGTCVMLLLGFLGYFNLFKYLEEENESKMTEQIVRYDGRVKDVDLLGDTRTFIYHEVIASSIKHDYVLWGRTPARGNDNFYFKSERQDEKGNVHRLNERHVNEVCHLNVYTWIGLVGVVLYSLIYLKASTLAVFHSRNVYMRFLGVFVAFRWALGWIEDINLFFILSIVLWLIVAMCMSRKFRDMSDTEFKTWFSNCFPR